MKTYAIGDVHGRADLLEATLKFIEQENGSAPENYRVVFLGDIIDRGPDSRPAMDLVVRELHRRPSSRMILGNHEEFLLLFVDRPDKRDIVFHHWMQNGGLATAASYGLDVVHPYKSLSDAHRDLLNLLERHPFHIAAMRQAESMVYSGDYILVHAGLRPGVPLAEQTTKDLRTIREDFLLSRFDFGKTIVHGHSINSSIRPEIYDNRIGLDTGADRSSVLCAAVFEDGRPNRFLAARTFRGDVQVSKVEPVVHLTLAGLQAKVGRREPSVTRQVGRPQPRRMLL